MKKSILPALFFFMVLNLQAQKKLADLDFLVGTWKVTDKATFEMWEKKNDSLMIGESYKLVDGVKTLMETLTIQQKGENLIYNATVLKQNEGKTISFDLNNQESECFSFENLNHDFPKKIQYAIPISDKMQVRVHGENDVNFSIHFQKVE